jgi:hypothetical protein
LILFAAAVADAVMVACLIYISQKNQRHQSAIVVVGGLFLGIVIEKWALYTGSWAYGALMPIVPWFNIGLTPTIQLALTGFLVQKVIK